MSDPRDLTIELLALSEAELRARVVDLEAERDTYRALLQAALTELHALTMKHERLLFVHREMRAEMRDGDDVEWRPAVAVGSEGTAA